MAAVAKPHCNAGRKAALAPVPVPEIKIPNFEKDNHGSGGSLIVNGKH
jgi:hypothetical protein